ncbi:IS3 family transposase [Streptomyces sp. R35]|uniref:IS3 family transposase n=1 Tax=Streptomyces sp. R35 TaxID=3238630 RepID=A0AB39SJE5_9ACTN
MGEVAGADPAQVAGVISDFRTVHNILHRVSCRALGVSEWWFYKHRTRRPARREVRRQQLAEAVQEEFTDSGGTYGSPKIWIRLVRQGWRVSVNTVAKLMAELGLVARKVRRRRGLTRPGKRPAAADFVNRDFAAEAPDLVWCGDMTEIETGEGKFDRGSEYASRKFRRACRKLGVSQSMGIVGSCFDNAVSEAFNSILNVEYVHRHAFATRTEARIRIATWITDYYNARRLLSVCGFKSPIDYERDYWARLSEGLAA